VPSDTEHRFARARHKKHGGGLGWLLVLALIVFAVWFCWWREHHKKTVRIQPAAAARPQLKPLIIGRQSPGDFPRPVHDVFEAQMALARRGISPGSIDAALGSQTRAAISVFQEIQNLPRTGLLDTDTRARLLLTAPMLTT